MAERTQIQLQAVTHMFFSQILKYMDAPRHGTGSRARTRQGGRRPLIGSPHNYRGRKGRGDSRPYRDRREFITLLGSTYMTLNYAREYAMSWSRKAPHASSCETAMYSSALCAWSIEPGPMTTVGM